MSAFGYNANRAGSHRRHRSASNRIWFNGSYDEGGGDHGRRRAAGRPRPSSSRGHGPGRRSTRNVIQANLANDDGGGIRLLQTSGSHISRTNPAADHDHQQHHRQQRLGPRGWRHRPGRRGLRQHRRQHGGQEPDHGHRRDQQRRRRPRPGCRPRPTATRCRPGCATQPVPRQRRRSGDRPSASRAVRQRVPRQPRRQLQRRLRLPASAARCPTATAAA